MGFLPLQKASLQEVQSYLGVNAMEFFYTAGLHSYNPKHAKAAESLIAT